MSWGWLVVFHRGFLTSSPFYAKYSKTFNTSWISLQETDKLIRLWVHEVYRVFYDRLVDDEDRAFFFDLIKDACKKQFNKDMGSLMQHLALDGKKLSDDNIRSLFFGDYMTPDSPEKVYDEVLEMDALTKQMER